MFIGHHAYKYLANHQVVLRLLDHWRWAPLRFTPERKTPAITRCCLVASKQSSGSVKRGRKGPLPLQRLDKNLGPMGTPVIAFSFNETKSSCTVQNMYKIYLVSSNHSYVNMVILQSTLVISSRTSPTHRGTTRSPRIQFKCFKFHSLWRSMHVELYKIFWQCARQHTFKSIAPNHQANQTSRRL